MIMNKAVVSGAFVAILLLVVVVAFYAGFRVSERQFTDLNVFTGINGSRVEVLFLQSVLAKQHRSEQKKANELLGRWLLLSSETIASSLELNSPRDYFAEECSKALDVYSRLDAEKVMDDLDPKDKAELDAIVLRIKRSCARLGVVRK